MGLRDYPPTSVSLVRGFKLLYDKEPCLLPLSEDKFANIFLDSDQIIQILFRHNHTVTIVTTHCSLVPCCCISKEIYLPLVGSSNALGCT